MTNRNYLAGTRMERARKKFWEQDGYEVVRSAGSHGLWDLCAVHKRNPNWPVLLIQCKRVSRQSVAETLIKSFRKNPPLTPSAHYHFVLEVQVKGTSVVQTVTV